MKNILGLDLGTNSIGWCVVSKDDENRLERIEGIGSRIIPMSQDILGNFAVGNSVSQTAERTAFRSVRRLRERHLLRRERLLRILHLIGFLPEHYDVSIGWDKTDHRTFAKFKNVTEPKIAWKTESSGDRTFIFEDTFKEMLAEFMREQPESVAENKKIPYDWTIYYLRKKALEKPITKEELAWIILNFNQKRGYYQLRGEDDEQETNKVVGYYELNVVDVQAEEPQKGKKDIWYNVVLENGWVYRRSSKVPLTDWIGKAKEFIVTTELNPDGTPKKDKEGNEKRSFRAPSENDWMLVKKKTESNIEKSQRTVGCYIYETLLQNPAQKIKGKLIRTIERKFYKQELGEILKKQAEFHSEFQDKDTYRACIEELYPQNENRRLNLASGNLVQLLLEDIIFYQRPLKSKKSLISNCRFEYRVFIKDGQKQIVPLKCIAKSNPLFQEFRLWQFIQDLRIYQREKEVDGKLKTDVDVTTDFLPSEEAFVELFDWLNDRKEISQKILLKYLVKKKPELYRWNYVEDKIYPCNETRALILERLGKCDIPLDFLTKENEISLWHILYSVNDLGELAQALKSFAARHRLNEEFVKIFRKFPPFKNEYGAYSEKAVKKLLPLMRLGKYWQEEAIDGQTKQRIEKLLTGEYDETIRDRVRQKAIYLTDISCFKGLPAWLASYIVYDRHAEIGEIRNWKTPQDIERYLHTEFKQYSLRNPIVEQVITETLRTVKDIWQQYGDFSEIHVELGREMKLPAAKRAEKTKQNAINEDTNLRLKALLMELQNDPEIENVRAYSPSQLEILKIYEEGALVAESDELPEDIAKISKMNQPTQSELIRYKLWLEQKYRSPYTGEIIPLSKLFTPAYEIEHVIPQSRYFDNSLSNKVICESEINKLKDNALGYEFIRDHEGEIVASNFGKKLRVFTLGEYEQFVRRNYSKNGLKIKKLLLEDIPDSFIQRQMNDTRYISKEVMSLLSNIVREEEEQEISKNVISCSGGITDQLKKDWGLHDVWNKIITPRFVRLNGMTNSTKFGEWKNGHFQTQMPLELQKGFNKKRIDHRHHAMDALVIACATRSHINYLNNVSSTKDAKNLRYDLKHSLCEKSKPDANGNYSWLFKKPWETFTQDTYEALKGVVVSFKKNVRVINKTTNYYQAYDHGEKVVKKQVQGDSWAIRKSLHKASVFGKVSLRRQKEVRLSVALENWSMLVDKELKEKIRQLITQYGREDVKLFLKYFKDRENEFNGKDISKVAIYYWDTENAAIRKPLDSSFTEKEIRSITDTGIQQILLNHLQAKGGQSDIAFSPEGLDELNKNLAILNNGKVHKPIYKVRISEPIGNKYQVGETGNKSKKFVEADKGTNLFFALYKTESGKRIYSTVPLSEVVERQKQGLLPVSETDVKNSASLLFWLSPNDLVYVPTVEERENMQEINWRNLTEEQTDRIYKMVSCTGNRVYFIQMAVANPIVNKYEFSPLNKMEQTIDGEMIKEICWKLTVDRLGHIVECIR